MIATVDGRGSSSRHGRRTGFEIEALPHLPALFGLALKLTGGDRAAAEDLVQDTLLKALRRWDTYEPGTNCRAWLMAILRNEFLSGCRRRKRRGTSLDFEDLDEWLHVEGQSLPDAEEALPVRLDDEVADAVHGLPEHFRRPVVLCDLMGLSYAEVAEHLGVVTGTVKSRLYRGRRALRSRLRGYAREMGYEAA